MRRYVGVCLALSLVGCASTPEKKEPTYTREFVEQLEKRVTELQQKVDEDQTQIAVLNERLENKGPAKAPETAIITAPPAVSFEPQAILQDDITDRYREGLILWNAKRFPDVISEMTNFAKDNSQSPLAPRALHMVASAHAELGEYPLAIKAWDALFMSYPNSSVIAEALSQYAGVADANNEKSVSDEAMQKLRNKFPHARLTMHTYKSVAASNPILDNVTQVQAPVTPSAPKTPKIPAINDFDEGEPE
jgi:TolA-binding protein